MTVIREELPEYAHRFTQVIKKDVWSLGGVTQRNHVSYGHCLHCGKQYLGPHDLYTECREAKRKALISK